MNNKINQELQKIEIPKDLHERSKLGVNKAKAEQQKRRFKNPIVAAAVILGLSTTSVGFAFPSIASQIPFMDNVINFFNDEEQDYKDFEEFSTEIGLVQTSNGITVMIDNAVYDGTNLTVSFAIETDHNFDGRMDVRAPNWFYVREEGGSGGTFRITKISENRYVGLSTFTPNFKDNKHPETIEVTWKPEAFYSPSNDLEVKGDWSFAFSLNRLEGDLQLVNQTVQQEDVSFTLQSVEFTDVSTVISYEQVVSDELLKEWASVTPVFHVTDDLGNVYMNGTGGGGNTTDDYKTFKGTTDFGTIKEGASKLIIQPIQIASLNYGKGHMEIELEPIVIDLKK
ncbi:DUF4179 domain-containing protein [Bacillus sp. JJ1521]|uniref:DUF4179 domain-containing protein n=1 Tax=Bacillus sp. JJ1521 TaxID=3122957 RepID=UPI002FFE0466